MSRRSGKFLALLVVGLVLVVGLLGKPATAHAAELTVTTCNEASLVAAFDELNANGSADMLRFACSGMIVLTNGGLLVQEDLTIDSDGYNVILDASTSGRVFEIGLDVQLTLNNLQLQNGNVGSNDGGAILNYGKLFINGGNLLSNAARNGGAIANLGGEVTITGTTFFANQSNVYGAALFNNDGLVEIAHSTFTSNLAAQAGGAVFNGNGTVTMINTTCYNTDAELNGGCLAQTGGGALATLTHVTMRDNEASLTGLNDHIFNTGGASVLLTNSIIFGRNGEATCSGGITDGGGNIAYNAPGCPGANLNPGLLSFGNYGNGNSTLPPASGSPAIDAAPNCAGQSRDQNGTVRPQGLGCDIGAVEVQQVMNPQSGQSEIVAPFVPGNTLSDRASEINTILEGEDLAHAGGMDDGVFARVYMEDGAWQLNPGTIPQDLVDYGVILAIDVWEQNGDQFFDNYERICLQGRGRVIYLDATTSPRTMTEITPVEVEDDYTCAWIPNAGTVVLIPPEPQS